MAEDLDGSVGERGESLSEEAAQPGDGGSGVFMLDAQTWRVGANAFPAVKDKTETGITLRWRADESGASSVSQEES